MPPGSLDGKKIEFCEIASSLAKNVDYINVVAEKQT